MPKSTRIRILGAAQSTEGARKMGRRMDQTAGRSGFGITERFDQTVPGDLMQVDDCCSGEGIARRVMAGWNGCD